MFLLLVSAASATEMTFTCPTVTAPPDARAYYDTSPTGVATRAWNEVYAWFDESCVVTCTSDWMGTCESASCVTSAGATLIWEEQGYELGDPSEPEQVETYILSVVPPASAGLGWTSATIERTVSDVRSYSYATSTSRNDSVAWTGELLAGWPVDGSFEASSWESDYSGMTPTRYERWGWSSAGCEWTVTDTDAFETGIDITVQVNADATIGVAFPYYEDVFPACDTEGAGQWRGYTDGVLYGNVDETTWERAGDLDGDGFSTDDCDDTDATVNPCATDVPFDGVDSDCNGGEDADGDGGVGLAEGGDDCNDGDATIFVGASEVPYDAVDQDCDGEDLVDVDGDGGDALVAGGDDCDDEDDSIFVGAPEVADDGVDQDCDGVDLISPDPDVDGDGADSLAAGGDDCDDTDATVFVGSAEIAYDGVDQDCDGADLTDVDADGADALAAGGDDCDDEDAAVFVGAVEVECDTLDQDCDGIDDCPPFEPEPTDTDEDEDDEEEATGCGGGAAVLLFPGLALLGVSRRRSRR